MNGSSKRGGFLAEKNIKQKRCGSGNRDMGGRYRAPQEKNGAPVGRVHIFSYVCGVLGILYALTFILILTCRQAEGR